MKKIIDKKTNKVNYGIYDGLIDFNSGDYVLHNFWDKPMSKFKQKMKFHMFHFISFSDDRFIIGMGYVDLSFVKNIFGYVYDRKKDIAFDYQKTITSRRMHFDKNIDTHQINFKSRSVEFRIHKDIQKETMMGHFRWKKIFNINYQVKMGFNEKPLRVLNPTDFNRWVLTAKRSGLTVHKIKVKLNNEVLPMNANNTLACTDWSGGYFLRNTNWIWGCGATRIGKNRIGFNFATFHNNALFPENAVWINNEREHILNIQFKWDYKTPYERGFEIYTLDESTHLYFKPLGEKHDIKSRGLGLIKTNFHQYFGEYSGHISCNGKKVKLPAFLGLFETHKALW